MKFTSTLAALVIGIVAALLTVSPMASRAADDTVHSNHGPEAQSPVQECPIAQPVTQAGCASTGSGPSAKISVVKRSTRSDQTGSEQNDATGKLLEDLIKKGPEMNESP
jgi:hypothetical protein